jgi:hypothetical protein
MIELLLYISLILLLAVELLYQGKFGDKHGANSAMALLWFFMLAAFLGLLIGQWQAIFTYLFLRIALFDLAFGGLFRGNIFYLGKGAWTDRLQANFNPLVRIIIWESSFTLSILTNFIL